MQMKSKQHKLESSREYYKKLRIYRKIQKRTYSKTHFFLMCYNISQNKALL